MAEIIHGVKLNELIELKARPITVKVVTKAERQPISPTKVSPVKKNNTVAQGFNFATDKRALERAEKSPERATAEKSLSAQKPEYKRLSPPKTLQVISPEKKDLQFKI